jgi:hypothetical protein
MKRLISLVLVATLGLITLAGAQTGLDPAKFISSNCLVYAQSENLNALLVAVESYAKDFGIDIGQGNLPLLLSSQVFGQPGFPGLAINRKAAVFVYFNENVPAMAMPGFVLLLPITSEAAFKRDALPKLNIPPNITPRYRDGYAVLALDDRSLREFNNGKRSAAPLFGGTQLQAYLNLRLIAKTMNKAVDGMGAMMTRGSDLQSLIANQMMAFYKDMLKQMFNQTLSLNLDKRGLEGGMAVEYDPKGAMAKLGSGLTAGEPAALAFMPADSILVSSGKVNWKAYYEIYAPLFAMLGTLDAELGKMAGDFVKQASANYKSEMTMALVAPADRPGMTLLSATPVVDPLKALATCRTLVARFNRLPLLGKLQEQGPQIKLVLSERAVTIAGVPVHRLALQLTPPSNITLTDSQKKILNFVTELLSGTIAYSGGMEFAAFGTEAESRIRELLNLSKGQGKGFKTSPGYAQLSRDYGKQAKHGVFYASLSVFLKELFRIAALIEPDNSGMARISSLFANASLAKPAVHGFYSYKGSTMSMRGVIGSEELRSLFQLLAQAQGLKHMDTAPATPGGEEEDGGY